MARRAQGKAAAHRAAMVNRKGRLAANPEGNEFSVEQLGDLVEATLKRTR